jgi:FAD dependent oxidoreductase
MVKILHWLSVGLFGGLLLAGARANAARPVDQTVACDIFIAGGGTAGVAAAIAGLQAGRTVCLTEITDWWGGQVSAQGTSALDEKTTQRQKLFFPQGYLELRQQIQARYQSHKTPGNCWVSVVCFLPKDGHEVVEAMLKTAAQQGKGTLKLFPNTVVKALQIDGAQIQTVRAIQHAPAAGAAPLNTEPLSQTLLDSYVEEDSARFRKTIIQFGPPTSGRWMVVEATETGELLALADVPYRVGVDARSYRNPSASSADDAPYCTQGFTYTFALEATASPPILTLPDFYPQYAQSYSYNYPNFAQNPVLVFTYRRIWSVNPVTGSRTVNPGDISMQNWNWGNDYGPGTAADNLIYTRSQLAALGQLDPGGWQGGLRPASLQGGEAQAIGFYYWLQTGTTDAKLGDKFNRFPPARYLQGEDSPMGTAHGLSKYPYIRESRRLMGRPAYGYTDGFAIDEVTVSRQNYRLPFYTQNLSPETYRNLATAMAGLRTIAVIRGTLPTTELPWRTRSHIYPDSVGIGYYPLDFHPCMENSPPESPGNRERPNERQGAEETYPFQIPLRAMIPQKLDNLLVTGKSIAMSHIGAAAYRVHAIEWSAGAGAGTTAAFVLEKNLLPAQLVDNLPRRNPDLEQLQQRLNANGNPTAFPGTSILNLNWQNWK